MAKYVLHTFQWRSGIGRGHLEAGRGGGGGEIGKIRWILKS